MTIQFITRKSSKKHARIVILKPTLKTGKRGERVGGYEVIGTLPELDKNSLNQFSMEKALTAQEIFELETDTAQLAFNHQELNDPLDNLEKKAFYFSKPYLDALFQLWKLSRENNILFCQQKLCINLCYIKQKPLNVS